MTIQVTQLPPEELSPNARVHWAEKYQAAQRFLEAVYYSCLEQVNEAGRERWPYGKARVNLTFIFPRAHRRDRDNLLGMFKPGLDALVKVGLLVDDDSRHLEIGEVNIEVDRGRAPLTIIDLEEMPAVR